MTPAIKRPTRSLAVGKAFDGVVPINDATHFRASIENYSGEGCAEFCFPVGDDFEYAVEAWNLTMRAYDAWAARGDCSRWSARSRFLWCNATLRSSMPPLSTTR